MPTATKAERIARRAAALAEITANEPVTSELRKTVARIEEKADPAAASTAVWSVFSDDTRRVGPRDLKAASLLRRNDGGNDVPAEIERQLALPGLRKDRKEWLSQLKVRALFHDMTTDEGDPPAQSNQEQFDAVMDFAEAILADRPSYSAELQALALATVNQYAS